MKDAVGAATGAVRDRRPSELLRVGNNGQPRAHGVALARTCKK
jgi:hypothetical protein